jgi:heme exporter protein C
VPRPNTLRTLLWLWFALAAIALAYGLRLAAIAPIDGAQGTIGSMIYYHVPMQVGGLTFPCVNLIGSFAFLYYRKRDLQRAISFDALAVAAAEVTVLFLSVGILSGMLWAKPAWGIWWTWDERLTTCLLLWLLYVSYLLVRRFSSTGQVYTLSAVLSVFAAIDVPIVYYSTQWWRTQHPSPVFFSSDPNAGLDPSMKPAFFTNFAAWLFWGFFLIALRYALERRRQRAHHAAVQQAIANPEAQ